MKRSYWLVLKENWCNLFIFSDVSAAWKIDCRCLVWHKDTKLIIHFRVEVRNDGDFASEKCPFEEE